MAQFLVLSVPLLLLSKALESSLFYPHILSPLAGQYDTARALPQSHHVGAIQLGVSKSENFVSCWADIRVAVTTLMNKVYQRFLAGIIFLDRVFKVFGVMIYHNLVVVADIIEGLDHHLYHLTEGVYVGFRRHGFSISESLTLVLAADIRLRGVFVILDLYIPLFRHYGSI